MNTKLKVAVALTAIALVAAGCNQTSNNNSTNDQQASNPTPTPTISNPPIAIDQNQAHIITYTDSGFSPKTLTIHQGETVAFENKASDAVRVSSNPHPTHEGYPTTGGCVSSTFDSCVNISPGQMWLFTFDLVGSWGFHNHLNPSEGGTVVVQSPTSASAPTPTPTNKTAKKTAPVTGITTPSSTPIPTATPYQYQY